MFNPSDKAKWSTEVLPLESDTVRFPGPTLKYSEGGFGTVPSWAWKLVGVLAWAAFWWIVARAI